MTLRLLEQRDGVVVPVRVIPRSSRNGVDGEADGALRVRLTAPPVDGTANRALIGLVAGLIGVSKRDVELVSGHRSRQKLILIRGLALVDVQRRLAAALKPSATSDDA